MSDIYFNMYDYLGDFPHVGVVVFGYEYYYCTKGVKIIEPGSWGNSRPKKTVYKGQSVRTKEEFEDFLNKPDFKGYFYNIFHHNCITFATFVVKYLKGEDRILENLLSTLSILNPLGPFNFIVHRFVCDGCGKSE